MFSENAVFSEEIAKNYGGRRIWPFFRERRVLGQKIDVTYFHRELGNGYFIIEQVFRKKKNSIFRGNCENPICGRTWPF